jgi:hypothetical protein
MELILRNPTKPINIMAKVLSFDSALPVENLMLNAVRLIGLPENMERLEREAAVIAQDLDIAELPAGVCFAKLPWGHENRHFLWSALITTEHQNGEGICGSKKTTMTAAEFYGQGVEGPVERSYALRFVDREQFAKAEIYQGPDPVSLFEETFAAYPSLLERRVTQAYDLLMCLRAVERFRNNPFEPNDQIGAQRLTQFLENRRSVIRKVNPSGLCVGLDFGEPMID